MEPPVFGIARQILSGQGYQGTPIFKGGADLQSTMQANPQEALRGVLKSLWQFGASPIAPGQASTERLVKSIMSRTVPIDKIPDPMTQAFMKAMSDGPAAVFNQSVVGIDKKGSQPVPDLVDAFLRHLSVKNTLITPTSNQPGSALSNLKELQSKVAIIDKQMDDEMKQAIDGPIGDPQRREIQTRYARMRQPFLDKLR